MSHSYKWTDSILLAVAPLGIITAVVSAIRVGGPSSMKVLIGRGRESRGIVEAELLSSTSSDVCELWSGSGLVRLLGSANTTEIICSGNQVYSLRTAIASRVLTPLDRSNWFMRNMNYLIKKMNSLIHG